jgi:hypothetical protein
MILLTLIIFSAEKVTTLRIPMENMEKCEKAALSAKKTSFIAEDVQVLTVKCVEKKPKERTS